MTIANGSLYRFLICVAAFAVLAATATAGIIDPCLSTVEIVDDAGNPPPPGPGTWLSCPQGDGTDFIGVKRIGVGGWGFHVWIEFSSLNGDPIEGLPASDVWIVDCDPVNDLTLCGGSSSSNADSNSNAQGMTTISNTTLSAGGCADGISIVAQGFIIQNQSAGCIDQCLPVNVRSPDIDGSLTVNLVDLSIFAASFPPAAFDTCCDFNGDGIVGLQDLSELAFHFGPPGHTCN